MNSINRKIVDMQSSKTKDIPATTQYQAIIQASIDGFWLIDSEGNFLDVNDAYCHLIGYTRDELLTMKIQDVEAKETHKETVQHIKKVIEIGHDRFETRQRHKNGTIIDIDVSTNYMDSDGGRFFVFLRDITERKKADEELNKHRCHLEDLVKERTAELQEQVNERQKREEELRESEQKYRNLFVNMINGFAYHKIVVDNNNNPIDYVFLDVNDAFERYTGLKREIIIGKKVTEIISGIKETKPDLISAYGNVALTGKDIKFELHFEPFKKWYSVSAYSPRSGYFVTVFDDITERKLAEKEVNKRVKELEDFYDIAIGRELRIKSLKEENDILKEELKSYKKQ
jgi:two-component system, cell cycle sensor histidine kinase and response regulator CckA